ncbi:hypothetical protein A3G54_02485 [Candidatus Giovannonibacteria bacterium RIFCSPLOWO2_12_FULL_44_15]|uniref:Uncharacterized protein n=1 Tax=Candidatus Giovannonibacteria bacterium RIFCSPLOWO2_12_FULL_44_15 TaxID=1798364 RepID=A0A1F5XYY1_9BACT|nr:MAG: hypothetical protein A3E62_02290 [Candidatus Giovannonibacteria bacterium RIFCSPHIGHO2_12_FULL_44_29]OGF93106.1 MAG: hypothetical protein A3G54_02485 [Candidatus Giovannonibacteria bacterium RIFCSPLOWO2_12_FULL_44_15]
MAFEFNTFPENKSNENVEQPKTVEEYLQWLEGPEEQRLKKELERLNEEYVSMDSEALELWLKSSWPWSSYSVTPEMKAKMRLTDSDRDAVCRNLRDNTLLGNEIRRKSGGAEPEDRAKLNLDNPEEFVHQYHSELLEAGMRVNKMMEGIGPGDKISVEQEYFGSEECYVNNLDVQRGLLYITSDPVKKDSAYAVSGIDARYIKNVRKL